MSGTTLGELQVFQAEDFLLFLSQCVYWRCGFVLSICYYYYFSFSGTEYETLVLTMLGKYSNTKL